MDTIYKNFEIFFGEKVDGQDNLQDTPIYWINFINRSVRNIENEQRPTQIHLELKKHNAYYIRRGNEERNSVIFETEADAIAFILKWA
jgi:hypothetical protein